MATTRLGLYGGPRLPYGTFAGKTGVGTVTASLVTVIFRPSTRKKMYADLLLDMMTKRTLSETLTITLSFPRKR